MHSVEQADEVQNQMQHAVELAASPTPRPAGEMEQALWTVLLGIGRALMALYFAGQAERWGLGRRYRHEGRTFEVVEHESWEAGTRFGKVACQRPAGRDVANRRRARDLPLNREVGLAGGFTMPVVLLVTRLCAQMAFASARTLFKSMLGWAPSPRAVLRMVDAAGQHAVAFANRPSRSKRTAKCWSSSSTAKERRACRAASKHEGADGEARGTRAGMTDGDGGASFRRHDVGRARSQRTQRWRRSGCSIACGERRMASWMPFQQVRARYVRWRPSAVHAVACRGRAARLRYCQVQGGPIHLDEPGLCTSCRASSFPMPSGV